MAVILLSHDSSGAVDRPLSGEVSKQDSRFWLVVSTH